jgi:hypothetical protein
MLTLEPQLLEQLRTMLQAVSVITLVDDLTAPVSMVNDQVIMAQTVQLDAVNFTQEYISNLFTTTYSGKNIALYQVYSLPEQPLEQIDPTSFEMVTTTETQQALVYLRFASY